mgnify:FL=1
MGDHRPPRQLSGANGATMATHGDLLTAHRKFYLGAQMVRRVAVVTVAGCAAAVSSALLVGGVTTGAIALASVATALNERGDGPSPSRVEWKPKERPSPLFSLTRHSSAE